MDENPNTVQQTPVQLVDTGPMPLDVLQARMILLERELLERERTLREQLQQGALDVPAGRLAQLTDSLRLVKVRLETVRQLRGDW